MVTLKAMQVFVETVDGESLAQAARTLNIGPSAVSKQIAALEEELGVRLLQRTTRSISLTEEGEYFFEQCQAVLARVSEACDTVSALADQTRGTLRVVAPPTFGHLWLSRVLSEFRTAYPMITLKVWLSDDPVDLVHNAFDVAIQEGALPDSTLVARKLAEGRHAVCAAPSYLERAGRPATPSELADHDCITSIRYAPMRHWPFRDADTDKSYTVSVTGTLSTNSFALMLDAALSGQGIVRLPMFAVARHLRSGDLVSLFDESVAPGGGIWALYPTRRHLPKRIELFLDFLSARAARSSI